MSKNTSITLNEHFEAFVHDRISSGRFNNTSEVIRAGLRLLEEEEAKVEALRSAIQDGIESGRADSFDPELHLLSLKDQRKSDG